MTGKRLIKLLFFVFLFVVPLRLWIGEPCCVPSESMENTILQGDWLWIDKVSYGGLLPRRWADIPLLNIFTWFSLLREADERIEWKYRRLPGFTRPKTSDLIIFHSPENERFLLVKRLIGNPGDHIRIINGKLKINNRPVIEPFTFISTTNQHTSSLAGFPEETAWSIHNYGPIWVPGKNVRLPLTDDTYPYLSDLIEKEGNTICKESNKIYINGKVCTTYQFKYDYYFVMGDNRGGSRDSRFFGFVAEQAIVGKVNRILFSFTGKDGKFKIHRILKGISPLLSNVKSPHSAASRMYGEHPQPSAGYCILYSAGY